MGFMAVIINRKLSIIYKNVITNGYNIYKHLDTFIHFKRLIFIYKVYFRERKGKIGKKSLSSAGSFTKWWTTASVEKIRSKPDASPGSPTWIQTPKNLDHPCLLPQAKSREQDQKWNSGNMKKYSYRMPTAWGERWACCTTRPDLHPHIWILCVSTFMWDRKHVVNAFSV